MRFSMKKALASILNLIFPKSCEFCSRQTQNTHRFCDFCLNNIDYTPAYNEGMKNMAETLLFGKVPLEFGYALFYFEDLKVSQAIIHSLKYKSNHKIGILLGKKIAKCLLNIAIIETVDLIIPVPIHHKRRFTRGYNQSEIIATGMSEVLNIKIGTSFIKKKANNKSQTKLSAKERLINNDNIFICSSKQKPKHILIIDDVITTGNTIENICKCILNKHPKIKISVTSLGIAKSNK